MTNGAPAAFHPMSSQPPSPASPKPQWRNVRTDSDRCQSLPGFLPVSPIDRMAPKDIRGGYVYIWHQHRNVGRSQAKTAFCSDYRCRQQRHRIISPIISRLWKRLCPGCSVRGGRGGAGRQGWVQGQGLDGQRVLPLSVRARGIMEWPSPLVPLRCHANRRA